MQSLYTWFRGQAHPRPQLLYEYEELDFTRLEHHRFIALFLIFARAHSKHGALGFKHYNGFSVLNSTMVITNNSVFLCYFNAGLYICIPSDMASAALSLNSLARMDVRIIRLF